MASNFDGEEFIDEDFRAASATPAAAMSPTQEERTKPKAPSREEVEQRVSEMQQKLTELKRAQDELERQRTSLEELRRRQGEFATGRQEMIHHLTRGISLLEDAELAARRKAEQMSKILAELRDALSKIQTINEERWTKDNLEIELTRANTIIENARMEWNAAQVKLPVLSGEKLGGGMESAESADSPLQMMLHQKNYAELCKMGLALTWPLALTGLAIFLLQLIRG
jgi:chromosome segregation ATPase